MNPAVAAAAVGVGVGGVVAGRIRAARRSSSAGGGGGGGGGGDGTRWQAVTISADEADVTPGGRLPEPLAALGDRVETRVRPAPGGRGTELAARLRAAPPAGAAGALARARGVDPRQDVRSALRRAKQLVEVGEVLAVDPVPHGRRGVVGTALVGSATRRAGREGIL